MLLGRARECAALELLLDEARRDHGAALVVRGERGVGKTALLDHLARQAGDCRVARAAGAQQELQLPFAALHQLCAPLLDGLDRLPQPRRDALGIAFGLCEGEAPAGFLVAVATLGLLVEAASERPLLCLIDDGQWLDRPSAEVLGFAARRLACERIALVIAADDSGRARELRTLPELHVDGLTRSDARTLLRATVVGPLDDRIAERIAAETAGNPRTLLELCRGLAAAELAGGFGVPRVAPDSVEERYARRLQTLPADTRRLLLVAAAEPVGDAHVVWQAAAQLGIGHEAAGAAAGLAELNGYVRFRHPRVRGAIYVGARADERCAAHRALATVTDPQGDPDMRVWHSALAAAGPDDAVADELERSADRAEESGRLAAAGAFRERATLLTSQRERRATRALAAARALLQAGATDAVLEMLALADLGPLGELERAQAEVLRARVSSDSAAALLHVGRRLEELDARLARECYLDAYALAPGLGPVVAARVQVMPTQPSADVSDLLFEGMIRRASGGFAAGLAPHRRAVRALLAGHADRDAEIRWLPLAARVAMELWDHVAWEALAQRQYRLGRELGALALLPSAIDACMGVRVLAGDLAGAETLRAELEASAGFTRRVPVATGPLLLAAWRGDERTAFTAVDGDEDAVHWAAAVLLNARGHYEEALSAGERAANEPFAAWALGEIIEAAVRSGHEERAAEALARLTATTSAVCTEWALGAQSMATALVVEGDAAERHYLQAIERFDGARLALLAARARLLYGEWLRRERRRRDARDALVAAHGAFAAMGADAFAERAARELRATGKTPGPRTLETRHNLTERELQIARLARDGLANAAIGTRLFISPRTVEYHLSKIFTKLGISSRTQLADELPEEPALPG